MAWDGKVTNVGLSLLEQWGTGSQTLHIDKATIGTGTVPTASLIASTTVAGEIGETPITGSSVVTGGIQYQVQVQPQTAAYTLHQIGVWGHLGDSGTATLIAVFQEEDGINIPADADEPGYALTVYCTVAMSNTGSITINLSGGAYATLDMMNAALALKAPIASPALTGTPTAPTAAAGTNTTQIATTAFVQTGLAGKQNTLTFDTTPTSGSTNPVTSGGVYAKIGAVGNTPLQTQVTNLSNKVASVAWTPAESTTLLSFLLDKIKDRGAMPFSFVKVGSVVVTDVPNLIKSNEFCGIVNGSNQRMVVKIWIYTTSYALPVGGVWTRPILNNAWNGSSEWAYTPDASTLGISENSVDNTALHAINTGDFVYWNGTLRKATANIAVGATLSTSNLTAVSGGGLNALQAQMGWSNTAGFHNSIFRGKSLGTSVTAAQWAAIGAGTFDDLFIGDYWTINGIVWRIAAFDYWYNCGDTACTTHHVVIVPDANLLAADGSTTHWMNATKTTEGAYVGSDFYTGNNGNTGKSQCTTKINSAFGAGHILTHREYLQNAVRDGYGSAGAWYNSTLECMNEQMVYGGKVFGDIMHGTNIPASYTISKSQLPLFALAPSFICNRAHWWLRDVVSATDFADVYVSGYCSCHGAAFAWVGLRPAFGIRA